MKKIAIYGKGGIGKSTTTSNLAMAFARLGLKVLLIGCDPKSDSTQMIMHGRPMTTVLDLIRDQGDDVALDQIVREGAGGVLCVEAGGPMPGVGCAGRGIITAFEKLEELRAYEIHKPDIVLYDVLGDVVCGGFAMPLRGEYADYVFIVTSGEKMALYAAGNIAKALDRFKMRGYARLGGLILNRRNIESEREKVEEFAQSIGTEISADIPRSPDIQRAEDLGMTAVEAFPESEVALCYAELAKHITDLCV